MKNQVAFDYLKAAANNGSLIVIRIYPSPGNFLDALDPQNEEHTLLAGVGQFPVGVSSYCGLPDNDLPFRGVDDIALEIKAIHAFNLIHGLSEYGFEPANEPNSEWYPDEQDINLSFGEAWMQMDNYFVNLYDQVHPGGANPDIHVLTPPMAQFRYAEPKNYRDCTDTFFNPIGYPNQSGYDLMPSTFGLNSPAKNDGYSWHNYWRLAKENWAGATPNSMACPPGTTFPTSNHMVQFFPQWLRDKIVTSPYPRIISEADLFSPCLDPANNLSDKDFQASTYAGPSLRTFIQQEQAATVIAIWNLSIQYSDSAACVAPDTNDEFAWHEAYRESGAERPWFTAWWLGDE